jgi:hypothetical protein
MLFQDRVREWKKRKNRERTVRYLGFYTLAALVAAAVIYYLAGQSAPS